MIEKAINIFLFLLLLLPDGINKVNAQIITTFAGNGLSNYSGDGGPAINAEFTAPIGITFL